VHDFIVEDASCRFIYYETISNKLNPPWLDFINNQLTEAGPIAFESVSESPNGILFIAIGERIFAAIFGRSASSCLAKKALENDFGIKTAMNMCGNEEILRYHIAVRAGRNDSISQGNFSKAGGCLDAPKLHLAF
jgi:uncharacterized protein (TIGR04141 family)